MANQRQYLQVPSNYIPQYNANGYVIGYLDPSTHKYYPVDEQGNAYYEKKSNNGNRNSDKDIAGTSLLPIKGISNALKTKLTRTGIADVPSLLVYGRTVENRKKLAEALNVDRSYVDSWLKQADLWRVPGMTPDIAFLLVQAGVRNVEDLSNLDVKRALPLLYSLGNVQTDFTPPTEEALTDMIIRAGSIVKASSGGASFYQLELSEDDKAPAYLMDQIKIRNASMSQDNFSVIQNGFASLGTLGLSRYRPLPSKIRGQVVCKKGTILAGAPDQLVEISGFLSSGHDSTDTAPAPSSYTDDQGRFELTMPDAYCFKEVVTFRVRTRDNSYSFIKNASDIINLQLDDDNAVELESPFIVDGSHIETKVTARALPSVALMGEGDKIIRLSSDTAPSRIYSYKILNRLVEPKLSRGSNRLGVTAAIDVDRFQDNLKIEPTYVYKMSSLGIGYVLNMHQAWVPDGFALGSLLYSLILAPGEEQKIILREREQSYDIGDEATAADITSESYEVSQTDDEDAAYDYALNQLSNGGSSYSATTKTSSAGASGALGGLLNGISFGLSVGGGWSKTTSSGNSSAYQRNAHNEASSFAQNFQHAIKSASERIAQTKRVSIRAASGDEAEGVTSKIIANNNHSHVMTVQYWEVMRRYKVETTIDGVDMVLFVPLELIDFLPTTFFDGLRYKLDYTLSDYQMSIFNKGILNRRYKVVLKYYDVLHDALPWKYRSGLELMRHYSELPDWKTEDVFNKNGESFHIAVSGNFVEYDRVSVRVYLKGGKGMVEGVPVTCLKAFASVSNEIKYCQTRKELKETLRKLKNEASQTLIFKITLPDNSTVYDLSHMTVENHPEPLTGKLCNDWDRLEGWERKAIQNYNGWLEKNASNNTFLKETYFSTLTRSSINHYKQGLPECFTDPDWSLSERDLMALGETRLKVGFRKYDEESESELRNYKPVSPSAAESIVGVFLPFASVLSNAIEEKTAGPQYNTPDIHLVSSVGSMTSKTTMNFVSYGACLRYRELLRMEETFHHILSDVVRYSQVVWASFSTDERAIMLEKYTIDISQAGTANETIPLLNCVNVMEPLGFYGNCMLFPFTMPEGLSEPLTRALQEDGRLSTSYQTEKDWQDALYNYHTNSFRVPTTVISLPTDGMIGEAVLGETNVSELIDLTRFWNWKDSDSDKDHVSISSKYLKSNDLLDDVTTGGFVKTAEGAVAPTAVKVSDLVSALVAKQTPKFSNMTGQEQLAAIMDKVTASASTGRDKIVESNSKLAQAAMDAAIQQAIIAAPAKAKEEVAAELQKKKEEEERQQKELEDAKNQVDELQKQVDQLQQQLQLQQQNPQQQTDQNTPENQNAADDQNTQSDQNNQTDGGGAQPEAKLQYSVEGISPIAITEKNGSWAAQMAMILSWKQGTLIHPKTMLDNSGDSKLSRKFKNDKKVDFDEIKDFLPKIGMTTEARDLSAEVFVELLSQYGPLLMCLSDTNNSGSDPSLIVVTGIHWENDTYVLEYRTESMTSSKTLSLYWVIEKYKILMSDKKKAGIGLMRLMAKKN